MREELRNLSSRVELREGDYMQVLAEIGQNSTVAVLNAIPLAPQTVHRIGDAVRRHLRPGSLFISTSKVPGCRLGLYEVKWEIEVPSTRHDYGSLRLYARSPVSNATSLG